VHQYHRTDGADAMARLLDAPSPPDGVFCFNDALALGALRTLLRRGIRVPEDIALAGFDDIEESRFSTPTLTTISPDKERIAELALGLLSARIAAGAQAEPRTALADFTLLIRESTIGIPGSRAREYAPDRQAQGARAPARARPP
jgi:DNA-binding LacI/PurR family transcriptional regulator